jgi:uncharacterized protein (UPF0332 family)
MTTPEEFLLQAESWIALPSEADWRSAVSRGYYAAFHAARRLLSDLKFQPQGGPSAHDYLWKRLSNSGHPLINGAGGDLHFLRGKRNFADYNIHQTLTHASATDSVRRARLVVERLAIAFADPVRSQVIAAIRAYEHLIQHPTYQGP